MPDTSTITLVDYNGERSRLSINVPNLNGASFDATKTAVQDLQTAALAITLGTAAGISITDTIRGTVVLPTDQQAQREQKWLITAEDVSEFLNPPDNDVENPGFRKLFTYELPTADPALLQGNSEVIFPVEVPDPTVTNFIAEFESIAVSPYGGTLNVRQIRYVGRNL